jgi:hypothetical protein
MRFYRALLHLYPKSFRMEYGEEMCAVFALEGTSWLAAIVEVLRNARPCTGIFSAKTWSRRDGARFGIHTCRHRCAGARNRRPTLR